MMHLVIKAGIDVEESGLNLDEIKKDIVQFTKNLLILGAAEQEIGLVVEEVDIGRDTSVHNKNEGKLKFYGTKEDIVLGLEEMKLKKRKEKKGIGIFDSFQEAYSAVREELDLKTDEEGTRCVLKILDDMREQGNFNVRTALDIFDDARTVLFEMLRL